MTKPIISENFTVEDIRKIREYNSLRHMQMSRKEIVNDTKSAASKILKMMEERGSLRL